MRNRGRPSFFERRQIGIEKAKRVRRLDHADAGRALFVHDLVTERLHPRPVNLGPEVMFGVVAIKEPDPVV